MTARFTQQTQPGLQGLSPQWAERAQQPSLLTAPAAPEAISALAPVAVPSVYIPEYYEPNYAYPLVVWVQSADASVHQLQHVMPVISNRNYFGLAVRADVPSGGTAADVDLIEWEKQVAAQVRQLRSEYNIHSERIVLAGFGAGGTLALRLGLCRPEWFAGVATLGSRFPTNPHLLRRYRDLRGKRVLLGVGSNDRTVSVAETAHIGRLLHAAGMRVCTRVYDTGHRIVRSMLLDIDRWIMQGIYSGQKVG